MTDVAAPGLRPRRGAGVGSRSGIALANKAGYAPAGLRHASCSSSPIATRAAPRSAACSPRIPQMQERLEKLGAQIKKDKLTATATLEARYEQFIAYKPVPQSQIAIVDAGTPGLAGGAPASKAEPAPAAKKDEKAAAKQDEKRRTEEEGLRPRRPGQASGRRRARRSRRRSSARAARAGSRSRSRRQGRRQPGAGHGHRDAAPMSTPSGKKASSR